MKNAQFMRSGVLLIILAIQAGALALAETNHPGLDQEGIAKAFGKKGAMINETYKVTFPRSDLRVKVNAIPIKPGFALTSWAGFIKSGDSAIT